MTAFIDLLILSINSEVVSSLHVMLVPFNNKALLNEINDPTCELLINVTVAVTLVRTKLLDRDSPTEL